jgi:hypothetical protein
MLLNERNNKAGWAKSVRAAFQAITDGKATSFAIRLRRGWVAADIDVDGTAGGDAMLAFTAHLRQHGWAHFEAASGRPGHYHVIARLRFAHGHWTDHTYDDAVAWFAAAAAQFGITSQVRHAGALLRGVGAPHASLPGVRSTLLTLTPAEAMERVGLIGAHTADSPPKGAKATKTPQKAPHRANQARGAALPPARLTALKQEHRELALHGKGPAAQFKANGDLDGSQAVASLVLACAWAGYTLDETLAVLLNPNHAGAVKAWSRKDGEAWVAREYDKAVRMVVMKRQAHTGRAANPDLLDDLAAFLATVKAHGWPAQFLPTAMALANAICIMALYAGTLEAVGASQRQLAVLAGIGSQRQVWAALAKFVAAGLIERVLAHGPDEVPADRYRPLPATSFQGCGLTDSTTSLHRSVGHDAFTADGLGKQAWLVFTALTAEARAVAEIAAAVKGIPVDAVTAYVEKQTVKHLTALAEVGLAKESKRGWVLGSSSLDAAARRLGVTGAVARIAAGFEEDRKKHQARLAGVFQEAPLTVKDILSEAQVGVSGPPSVDDDAWYRAHLADLMAPETADSTVTDLPVEPAPHQPQVRVQAVPAAPVAADDDPLAPFPALTHTEAFKAAMRLGDGHEPMEGKDGAWHVVRWHYNPVEGDFENEVVWVEPSTRALTAAA